MPRSLKTQSIAIDSLGVAAFGYALKTLGNHVLIAKLPDLYDYAQGSEARQKFSEALIFKVPCSAGRACPALWGD